MNNTETSYDDVHMTRIRVTRHIGTVWNNLEVWPYMQRIEDLDEYKQRPYPLNRQLSGESVLTGGAR